MAWYTRTCTISMFAIIAAFAAPFSSRADENTLGVVEQVPANIHYVESGGYWAIGAREGFFRVLVFSAGVEHVSHSLFVQWLNVDPETGAYSIDRTREVPEFAGGAESLLQVDTSFGDANAFNIEVTAQQRDSEPRHFHMTVNGDGSYAIQEE